MSLSRFQSDSEYANRILNSLTDDERGYFIACTDIFHDKQYNVNGRPSVSSQLQNTVVLNLTRTITAADFGSVGNWDVNIFSLPFITTQVLATAVDTGFSIGMPTSTVFPTFGGVTMVGGDTGTELNPVILPATHTLSLNANTAVFPSYTATADIPVSRPFYQILSIGMEIINATPELYRGGNVIRYRIPTQGRSVPLGLFSAGTYASWPNQARENFRVYPLPPRSAAFASQYPDSVIDEAIQGSYQMHTLQDNVSDFYASGNERVFFSSPNPASSSVIGNSLISGSTVSSALDYDPPLVRGDFDIVGSYFTGLTPQSILTIRYRVILSQVPSSSDSFLSSLSKMSPPANDDLDQLISKVQNLFLPGIRAGMNPGGEWWKSVVNGLGKVAKAAGKSALKTALDVGYKQARIMSDSVLPGSGKQLEQAVNLIKMQQKQKQNSKKQAGNKNNSNNKNNRLLSSKVSTNKAGSSGFAPSGN